jgi:hypothetical protein
MVSIMDDTGSPLRIRTPPPDMEDNFESSKERKMRLQKRHYWQMAFTGMVLTGGIIAGQVYLGYPMSSLEVKIIFTGSVLVYMMFVLILLTQNYPRRFVDQPYEV